MCTLALKKSTLFLVFILVFITGCVCQDKPIEGFLLKGAPLAAGIDFETRKLVLLEAETGNQVVPCDPLVDLNSENQVRKNGKAYIRPKESIEKCKDQFVISDNSPESESLRKAIELSKKNIEGVIMREGEPVPATYSVIVIAVYNGSKCNTVTGPGTSGQVCHPKRRRIP
jgi:hypothetical protein